MVGSKSILTASAIAFAVIFGGGAYILMNLGSIAKNYAEKVASETLGVSVTIDSLNIELQNKVATANGLKIGNPDGFKKPHALTVDTIKIGLGTVSKELVDFENIEVSGTNAYLEVSPQATNFLTIKNQMKTADSKEAEAVKVIIKKILMSEMVLHPTVTLVETQDLEPINVPNLRLSGIGEKENGVLAKEAIAQIWSNLSRQLNNAAGDAGYLSGINQEALQEMGISHIEQLGDTLKKDLKDSLGGLFE